jgi:hypothetical protein
MSAQCKIALLLLCSHYSHRRYDIFKLDPNKDDIVTQEEMQKAVPNSDDLALYVRQMVYMNATLRGRNSENMFFFPKTERDSIIQAIVSRVAQTVGLPRSIVNKSDIQVGFNSNQMKNYTEH